VELETRLAPALLQVVPPYAANGLTSFATLAQALFLARAGDVVQVEPGSLPGGGMVTVGNLTVAGDPAAGAAGLLASGTALGVIQLSSNNNAVINLPAYSVTIDAGVGGEAVRDSILTGAAGVTQTFGNGADGGDTVSGCTFLNGAAVKLGNTAGSATQTAANDQITNNTFTCATPDPNSFFISATNETAGLVVSGNRIRYTSLTTGFALIQLTECTGSASGNTVEVTHNPLRINTCILITDNGPADTRPTNLVVTNNVITTGGIGIGIETVRQSAGVSFTVVIADNALAGNLTGLLLQGDGFGGLSDYGIVTAGGAFGTTTSPGGNDFRGYTGTHGDFAIAAFDPMPNASFVEARNNIFSVANPQTVVSVLGAGTTIDTGGPLTGGAAALTAMFDTLGGGPPTAVQHAALDNALAAQQASAAVHSPQASAAFVDGLYVSLLGRAPGAGEGQAAVAALGNGTLTEEGLIAAFVTSVEYYDKAGQGSANPNGAWVQSLYANLLGRQGTAIEVNAGITALAGGLSLSGLASVFVNSAEFRTHQVRAFYGVPWVGAVFARNLLKRAAAPPAAEIAAWVNTGLDLRSVELLILASPEFAANG
jgi:hypothetical protein